MFERPKQGERAILVHLCLERPDITPEVQEFSDLAESAGAEVVLHVYANREVPDPKYFVGTGKAEEIKQAVLAYNAQVVIFNYSLSPGQERNLESLIQTRVLDRTGLILDIFAQRARSHEGKLQVELAQLKHLSTRLIRGWTHLERQKGGIGLRGPGETQLEVDRRLIRRRIEKITQRLEKVRKGRDLSRHSRQSNAYLSVSLVGYTNAGKSTLFNKLTHANAYVADQLFATLDPLLRSIVLPGIGKVMLADTVGFVRDLPHDLVSAFRATLEETVQADLLLHVVDAQDPERLDKMRAVRIVLEEMGALDVPVLEVYNKMDGLSDSCPKNRELDTRTGHMRVSVSAKTGAGLGVLIEAMRRSLQGEWVTGQVLLPPTHGKVRAALYGLCAVQKEETLPNGAWLCDISLRKLSWERLCRQFDGLLACWVELGEST